MFKARFALVAAFILAGASISASPARADAMNFLNIVETSDNNWDISLTMFGTAYLTNAHFVGGVATGLHSNGGGSPVPFAFSVGQYPTVSEPVINWQDPFNPGYFNTVEIALSYGSDALYVFPDMSFIDDNIDAPGGLACLEGGAYSHCPVLQNGQSIEVLMSGYGTGAPGAFYLTETYTEGTGLPAPGGLALFGFGLAGLGALRRRKVA